MRPGLKSLGIASADEVTVDTLAVRSRDEAVATRATVVWQDLVDAVAHKPAQQ
jgi:hypothetical protein